MLTVLRNIPSVHGTIKLSSTISSAISYFPKYKFEGKKDVYNPML